MSSSTDRSKRVLPSFAEPVSRKKTTEVAETLLQEFAEVKQMSGDIHLPAWKARKTAHPINPFKAPFREF